MRGLRTVGLRLTCERSSRSRGSPLARQQAPRRPPRERIRADPERRTTVVIGKFHRVRSVVLNADWALNREGRHRALAPKVSQAAGSPQGRISVPKDQEIGQTRVARATSRSRARRPRTRWSAYLHKARRCPAMSTRLVTAASDISCKRCVGANWSKWPSTLSGRNRLRGV